jgi:hypothetical protein
MLSPRNLLVQLLLLVAVMALLFSTSEGFRIRADKKAMRNSLIRFGKRSPQPDADPSGVSSLYDQGIENVDNPQFFLYPMFGNRHNLY